MNDTDVFIAEMKKEVEFIKEKIFSAHHSFGGGIEFAIGTIEGLKNIKADVTADEILASLKTQRDHVKKCMDSVKNVLDGNARGEPEINLIKQEPECPISP